MFPSAIYFNTFQAANPFNHGARRERCDPWGRYHHSTFPPGRLKWIAPENWRWLKTVAWRNKPPRTHSSNPSSTLTAHGPLSRRESAPRDTLHTTNPAWASAPVFNRIPSQSTEVSRNARRRQGYTRPRLGKVSAERPDSHILRTRANVLTERCAKLRAVRDGATPAAA